MPRIGHLNPPSLFTSRKADAVYVSCASSPEFSPKVLFFLLGSLGSCIPIACSGVESSTQTLFLRVMDTFDDDEYDDDDDETAS